MDWHPGNKVRWDRWMIVTSTYFVANLAWAKRGDRWVCVEAAPILRYMTGWGSEKFKAYALKKGWTYQWVPTPGP